MQYVDSTSRMHSTGGFALVLILWMLAILSLIALGFGHRVRLENRAASYQARKLRGLSAAKAGVALAMDALRRDTEKDKAEGDLSDHPGELWNEGGDEGSLVSEGLFFTGDLLGTGMTYEITDECSKINLNHSIFDDANGGKALKDVLKGLGLLEPQVCENVVNWRRMRGFRVIEDLLAIDGITPEVFYGTEGQPGLKDFLTVGTWFDDGGSRFLQGLPLTGRIDRLASLEVPWVNVNTADPVVLNALLPTVASSVVGSRPFSTYAELNQILGPQSGEFEPFEKLLVKKRMFEVSSSFFSIRSTGSADDGKVETRITAVYYRGTIPGTNKKGCFLSWTDE